MVVESKGAVRGIEKPQTTNIKQETELKFTGIEVRASQGDLALDELYVRSPGKATMPRIKDLQERGRRVDGE